MKNVNQAKNRKDKRADPGKRGASQSESGQEKQTTQKWPTRNTVNVGRNGQHQKVGSKQRRLQWHLKPEENSLIKNAESKAELWWKQDSEPNKALGGIKCLKDIAGRSYSNEQETKSRAENALMDTKTSSK